MTNEERREAVARLCEEACVTVVSRFREMPYFTEQRSDEKSFFLFWSKSYSVVDNGGVLWYT